MPHITKRHGVKTPFGMQNERQGNETPVLLESAEVTPCFWQGDKKVTDNERYHRGSLSKDKRDRRKPAGLGRISRRANKTLPTNLSKQTVALFYALSSAKSCGSITSRIFFLVFKCNAPFRQADRRVFKAVRSLSGFSFWAIEIISRKTGSRTGLS
jgi:hypothetical protein